MHRVQGMEDRMNVRVKPKEKGGKYVVRVQINLCEETASECKNGLEV